MRQYAIAAIAVFSAAQIGATMVVRPTFAGAPELLVGAQSRVVFKQCSRAAPTPTHVLPPPSTTEIERLEQTVERHIAQEYEANRASPLSSVTYARQYVAYETNRRRMIYGNYFPISLEHSQGQAVVVCDGGAQFWGITFNPKTGKLESLLMNGNV